jgi:hypothetical protein
VGTAHIEIRPYALQLDPAGVVVRYNVVSVNEEERLAYPVAQGEAPLALPVELQGAFDDLLRQTGDHIMAVLGLAERFVSPLEAAAKDGTPMTQNEEPL